jgi:hypothetical protein
VAGRTTAEAVRLHLHQAQQLASCVTSGVLVIRQNRNPDARRTISFAAGSADLAGVRLKLEVRHDFRTFEYAGGFTLIVVGYHYALLDAAGREIIAYHWHPHGRSKITEPHLHLGPAAQVRQRDLAGAHLPTGMITFADVIELCVRDLGVVPRLNRWREVIAEVRAAR